MVFKPKLSEYDINVLVALCNQIDDEFSRNKIKMEIVEKILSYNYSMFYLINKFMYSKTIMKEAYADVILMNMKSNNYYIDDAIINEILTYASLDTLIYYGADSSSYEFSKKCKDEFWRRGYEIEDKLELLKKKNLGTSLVKKIMIKRKVIENDKY